MVETGQRRWAKSGRWTGRALGLLVVAYAVLVLGGWMNPSTPVDYAMNVGSFPQRQELLATDDGIRPVVVLQHGLWRSAASLWKLERALRDHGYRVLNESYGSTQGRIEEFAEQLATQLDRELGDSPARLHFVGHSMGGLVIEAYLLREGARQPAASVFVAVPHRGAVLADLRKDGLLFKVLMGHLSSLQLSPGHAFNLREIRVPGLVGTIVGGAGDAEGLNEDIPGDDDGTVAVPEAHLAGEDDSVTLSVGHTRISFDNRTILQVLHFLKHGRFDR